MYEEQIRLVSRNGLSLKNLDEEYRKVFEIVLAAAIAGGVFAIVHSVWHGRLRTVLANTGSLIRFHATVGAEEHPSLNLSNTQAARMPYGVAIAAGVLYSVLAFYCRGGI